MSRVRRALVIAVAASLTLAALGAWLLAFHTRAVATLLVGLAGAPVTLADPPTLAGGARWVEPEAGGLPYHAIHAFDERTFAIGEPRHPYQPVSYLIIGGDRAVLFDSGPGVRDITPVVRRLTDLPVIAAASHLHYDHIGDHHRFERVALADRPALRALADADGRLAIPDDAHLGAVESTAPAPLRVTEWWGAGHVVDLGGRTLTVWHTPGHTDGSMMLHDATAGILFSGDYLYPGRLLALFPGAHMGDYLATAEWLAERVPEGTVIAPGHVSLDLDPWRIETLGRRDVIDLRDALRGLRDGGGERVAWLPPTWRVNDRVRLIGDFPWNMRWARP